MARPTLLMKLHRDSSNRLTASLESEQSAYGAFVDRVVRRFELTPAGSKVVGSDEVFQDFGCGDLMVSLEWDNWMGCQVVAKTPESETLVEAIARFIET